MCKLITGKYICNRASHTQAIIRQCIIIYSWANLKLVRGGVCQR